jgi:hypothetical protein
MRHRQLIDPAGVVHDGVAELGATRVTRCEREGSRVVTQWTHEQLSEAPPGTATTCVQCIAGRRRG